MEKESFFARFRNLFSETPVNDKRQSEVDMAKALVACCLAAIHVFVECSTDEVLDEYGIAYIFDSILGGPMAAPMFMFCMGIGLTYSRNNTPKRIFIRGLYILVMGFLLNTARYLIPSLIGYAITKDYVFYLSLLPYKFFGNDIWQFAGLAHIFMALLLKLGLKPLGTFNVSIVMSAGGVLFNGTKTDSNVLNVILGHFIGMGDEGRIFSDFPLLLWFTIYSAGYVFGYYLIRTKDKDAFYRTITVPALVVSIGAMLLEVYLEIGMMGGSGANVFYHMTLPEAIVCEIFVIGLLGICHFAHKKLSDRAKRLIERTSRSLMAVYFIQWVLVWWTVDLFIYVIRGDKYFDWPLGLLIGVILGFLSVVLGIWWKEKGCKGFIYKYDRNKAK